MNKTLTVTLALVAGLVGGLLTRYIVPPVALAQNQAQITKEIRAQSFTLVDPSDHTVGTFSYEPDSSSSLGNDPRALTLAIRPMTPPRIVLRDSVGHELWSAGGTGIRRLSEK
jgi:hypothetical protein